MASLFFPFSSPFPHSPSRLWASAHRAPPKSSNESEDLNKKCMGSAPSFLFSPPLISILALNEIRGKRFFFFFRKTQGSEPSLPRFSPPFPSPFSSSLPQTTLGCARRGGPLRPAETERGIGDFFSPLPFLTFCSSLLRVGALRRG